VNKKLKRKIQKFCDKL